MMKPALLFILIFYLTEYRGTAGVIDQTADCLKCHGDVIGKPGKHNGIETECGKCHVSTGYEHPVKGKAGYRLIEQVPKLCTDCHSEMAEKMKSLPVVHGPLNSERSCLNCHLPHSSDNEKLLKMKLARMCLSCHDKVINKDSVSLENIASLLKFAKSVHEPVKNGECTTCHNPHFGDKKFMLGGGFPQGRYANGDAENYELCFTCHDGELLGTKLTETATGFRNGKENLHFVHSAGERGRNCRVCHNVHGAPGPKLIEDHIEFGEWTMKLGFKQTENGGSCATGCHGLKSYNRNMPVMNN